MNIRSGRGQALVEFAVVLPMFLLLILGSFRFGLTINNYVMLTEAVRAGGRQFALSRGVATGRTGTVNQVTGAAVNLVPVNCSGTGLCVTTAVSGVTCAADAACLTALTTATNATVTATYPCSLIVYGINFVPGGCTLTSTMTERVE